MIPASTRQQNAAAWQREIAEAVRDPAELFECLGLDPGTLPGARAAAGDFPLRVPRGYLARMRAGDPADPLLAQVLPQCAERVTTAGFGPDPVGDRNAMMRPGVLHKYHGRVLLVTTGACAVHCRYCFRREFPYSEANARAGEWHAALAYIAGAPDVGEVILSGGDPLSLGDAALDDLIGRIEAIAHVETLRIHSRLPVVVPARVTAALCERLAASRLRCVVVLHANHANEIDETVDQAYRRLQAAGATLLNQAVLLRGVNDSAASQVALARRLFACGVLPYYLHLLDPVRGAAHFEVPSHEARGLLAEVASRLPGYLLPRLVREEPGGPGKTPIPHDWDAATLQPVAPDAGAHGRRRGPDTP